MRVLMTIKLLLFDPDMDTVSDKAHQPGNRVKQSQLGLAMIEEDIQIS